jgi:hypothetical protein
MRFERWRGMSLALVTAAVGLSLAWVGSVRADGYRLSCTIPKTVPAYDYTTGGQYMAPPIPYGHYAKGLLDCPGCRLHSLLGCVGCGHGSGDGGGNGNGCAFCGGRGCNFCQSQGQGGAAPGSNVSGCGGGLFHHHKAGKFAPCDSGGAPVVMGPADLGGVAAASQSLPAGTAVVQPSSQYPCGIEGCGVTDAHSHGGHWRRCGLCGGKGCGGCGGHGLLAGCGDRGCGLCHGKGQGQGQGGCAFCGGKGCSRCLSGLYGRLAGLLHPQRVDYFVGAGGPVPLTPGYVPYIVVTRSPRDYFAFPPMNPYDP